MLDRAFKHPVNNRLLRFVNVTNLYQLPEVCKTLSRVLPVENDFRRNRIHAGSESFGVCRYR